MAGDSTSWMKMLDDRLGHLERTISRMTYDDEGEHCHSDTATLLQQPDSVLLVAERPARSMRIVEFGGEVDPGSSYMLNRFFGEGQLSDGGGGGAGGVGPGGAEKVANRGIKSIQHFFLQWNLIEEALQVRCFGTRACSEPGR
jgi:hypothetical protein